MTDEPDINCADVKIPMSDEQRAEPFTGHPATGEPQECIATRLTAANMQLQTEVNQQSTRIAELEAELASFKTFHELLLDIGKSIGVNHLDERLPLAIQDKLAALATAE